MFRVLLVLAFLLLSLPLAGAAQSYSAAEQEVLDQLAECWDLWMEGTRSGSPEGWIAQCTVPELTYWGAQDGAPLDNDFTRRNWDMASATDLGWVDIRPVSIQVMDDFAVLHFYGYWRAPGPAGEQVTEAKRTEVFRRMDGRWKMIAGHATPVDAADAAPYREIRR
jgi:hypothetical protein